MKLAFVTHAEHPKLQGTLPSIWPEFMAHDPVVATRDSTAELGYLLIDPRSLNDAELFELCDIVRDLIQRSSGSCLTRCQAAALPVFHSTISASGRNPFSSIRK